MRTRQLAIDAFADSAFAIRSFRRSPGWTLVTLVTIALGVGASTAVFRVADTFLVHPLDYRDASRVYSVALEGTLPREVIPLPMPTAVVREWPGSTRSIEAVTTFGPTPGALLRGDSDDTEVKTASIDADFLAFAGVRPLIGRGFTADETTPQGPGAVLIAEGFWRLHFGGSPEVLGKTVRLDVGGDPDTRLLTIVGVMPASVTLPDFRFDRPDVWLPLAGGAGAKVRRVAVRLKAGVSPDVARGELMDVVERAGAIDPLDRVLNPQLRLSRPQDALPFRQALILLTGAVIALLLIACSNVSHLLLQRGLTRERELAARLALGAHRGRLVRQLVTESLLIALAGGALAALVGWGALELLTKLRPASEPALTYLSTTSGVIPLAAGLAIAVGLAVGVFGALHSVHDRLVESLRNGGSSAPLTHRRLRSTLVVGQIALSVTLLLGAIPLTRAVIDLGRVRLGFDPRDVYAVSFGSRDVNATPSPEHLAARAAAIRDEAERAFGSRDLTIAATATTGSAFPSAFEDRESAGTVGPPGVTGINFVAPDYFSVLRLPLVAGRTFDAGSGEGNEVIVNHTLARRLAADGNVLGRQYRFRAARNGISEPWQTVVGVVPDIITNRLVREPEPMLYRPYPGDAIATSLIVRHPGPDAAAALRRFAKSVQADALQWRVLSVNARIEQSTAEPRFAMVVLVLFAGSGVLLAAVGLFGVLSYSVGVRTREIGIRVSLGAPRRSIAGLVLRDAIGQAVLGTALGLTGAAVAGWLTRVSFYGVEGSDATTFAVAAAAMLLVSLVACISPLFRAMRVDPAVALRSE